jgi:hypothetical protein
MHDKVEQKGILLRRLHETAGGQTVGERTPRIAPIGGPSQTHVPHPRVVSMEMRTDRSA